MPKALQRLQRARISFMRAALRRRLLPTWCQGIRFGGFVESFADDASVSKMLAESSSSGLHEAPRGKRHQRM